MTNITKSQDYKALIQDIKSKVQSAQIKAAISVNKELLKLYWEIAQIIIEKESNSSWGDSLIKQISSDLKDEFPSMKGFSTTNLKYMRRWYLFYEKSQQLVDQITSIPWGHNIAIFIKAENTNEATFYVQKTIENNWSRSVLVHQIENNLYSREAKAINNFEAKLPSPQSDLAKQTLKDPYCFDFLTLREKYDERDLENELINHVSKFLLELGAGCSFIGKEYRLEINGDEFFTDLLFYHVRLHSYVVVELKTVKFKPEFAGKLNFYVSAMDDLLKTELDNPTIGILICKSKNNTVVEYALKDVNKPIGVSEYTITKNLPDKFKSSLPSIEEIEAELND